MSETKTEFKCYICVICGWLYDEEAGSAADGLPPGTRWVDVPDDWKCPDCDAVKGDFDLIEIPRP